MSKDGTPNAGLLRALFVVRSRFAEDRLAEAAKRGVRQYVMLGAGLDTFPWRQPPFAVSMRLFATDHPASLSFARERLRTAGFSDPGNLTRVPIDLEKDDLLEKLAGAGCDLAAPSFLSILGVLQYLSQSAVDAVLQSAVALPPGSEIVLSFALPEAILCGQDLEAARRSVRYTENIDEPWRTRYDPRDLHARLVSLGFGRILHLTPAAANERYFAGRQDGLRAPGWEQLIAAVV